VLSFTEKGFVFRLTLTSSNLRLDLNDEFNPFSVDFQATTILFPCTDYFNSLFAVAVIDFFCDDLNRYPFRARHVQGAPQPGRRHTKIRQPLFYLDTKKTED
jgi:hypothetical protein